MSLKSKLFQLFGFGLEDTLTVYDDGYLTHKGSVTIQVNTGTTVVSIAVDAIQLQE